MSPLAIFKLLKEAKSIIDYRFKKNDLDQQMEMVLERLNKLDNDSHPPVFKEKEKEEMQMVLIDVKERISSIEKMLNNSDSNRKKKKKDKKTDDKQWYDD